MERGVLYFHQLIICYLINFDTDTSPISSVKKAPTTIKTPNTTPEIMVKKQEDIVTKSTEELPGGVKEFTDNGVECKTKCEKQGEMYDWCWQISGSWDYCIPGKFINLFL